MIDVPIPFIFSAVVMGFLIAVYEWIKGRFEAINEIKEQEQSVLFYTDFAEKLSEKLDNELNALNRLHLKNDLDRSLFRVYYAERKIKDLKKFFWIK